ncbi:phosphotransferase family protein [Microbacterium koreense]|uniref:Phosphotransferase family protein n=1 Tax=Microbacterium koreense TaxID=323761 RepID=A0ABW2ZPT3_9MICO
MGEPTDEMDQLCDALGVSDRTTVRMISREPLGGGSVAGFEVAADNGVMTYYLDTSRRRVPRETGLLLGAPDDPDIRVWLHPADPHLPALAPAAFSGAVRELLVRLGIVDTGDPVMVAYRPGRRAVLRVPSPREDVWVKVVRPARVAAIVACHSAFADAGIPVPRLYGWSGDGLIIGETARGTAATDAEWDADELLDEVDGLRHRIAGVDLANPATTRLARRLDWYSERLAVQLPHLQAERAQRIAERARDAWGEDPPVTIHGDLHFGQLFLGDDRTVSGIIDVDTAGVGQPSEDTAAFLAHAVASALLTPHPRDDRVWHLAQRSLARWGSAAVCARAAVHLLGHALGACELGAAARVDRLLDVAHAVSVSDASELAAVRAART